jgi:long-chain acyl-CoA synthetase
MEMSRGKGMRPCLYRRAFAASEALYESRRAGKPLSPIQRSRGWLAEHLVLRPMRQKLGWDRLKVALTGGEMLGPETARFLYLLGVPLLDSYGMAECPVAALQDGVYGRLEALGRAAPGQEVRLSPEGEIMVRGSALFQGYYKDVAGTRAKVRDGWFYTGDGGRLDETGRLVFLDRLTDVLRLEDGSAYSLQQTEANLKGSPYIKDALLTFGRQAGERLAVISTDFAALSAWANRKGIRHTIARELTEKPEVLRLIRQELSRLDVRLPLKWRVTKFVLLPFEFDPERQEMTRTGKLRRAFLRRRYFGKLSDRAVENKPEIALDVEGMGQVPVKVHSRS